MTLSSITAGTHGASAHIKSVFGVDATALFFVPADKSKAHIKTHQKCVAFAPVMHQVDAITASIRPETESDLDKTVGSARGGRAQLRYLYAASRYRCASPRHPLRTPAA